VDSLESPLSSYALDGRRRFYGLNRNETGTRSNDTFRPVADPARAAARGSAWLRQVIQAIARTAAHDVSIRSSTIPAADRRGRAAHSVGRLGLYAAHALLPVVLAACAGLGSGDKVSEGLYRLPYDDGTRVRVSNDHRTHRPPNRLDLVGVGAPPRRIVAAADGIVRYIVDEFDARQERTARQCYNNYVWLEHSNGEWTKYSHMRQHSVRHKANLREGNTVGAGTYLGDEGDVGCATGPHLHFEVAVPYNRNDPITPTGGFIKGRNLVPRICGVPAETLIAGTVHLAGHCVGGLRPAAHIGRSEGDSSSSIGFAGLARPTHDRALWALRSSLDSWSGVAHVAVL
jgi:hypothetical protein